MTNVAEPTVDLRSLETAARDVRALLIEREELRRTLEIFIYRMDHNMGEPTEAEQQQARAVVNTGLAAIREQARADLTAQQRLDWLLAALESRSDVDVRDGRQVGNEANSILAEYREWEARGMK